MLDLKHIPKYDISLPKIKHSTMFIHLFLCRYQGYLREMALIERNSSVTFSYVKHDIKLTILMTKQELQERKIKRMKL